MTVILASHIRTPCSIALEFKRETFFEMKSKIKLITTHSTVNIKATIFVHESSTISKLDNLYVLKLLSLIKQCLPLPLSEAHPLHLLFKRYTIGKSIQRTHVYFIKWNCGLTFFISRRPTLYLIDDFVIFVEFCTSFAISHFSQTSFRLASLSLTPLSLAPLSSLCKS